MLRKGRKNQKGFTPHLLLIKRLRAKFSQSTKGAGFTLAELLIVIAIISILAAVVMVSLNDARGKARDAKRVEDLRQVELALQLFFDEYGHYPKGGVDYNGVQCNFRSGVEACNGKIGDKEEDGVIDIDDVLEATGIMSRTPRDPLHDGSTYFYSYDSRHCTDTSPGTCDCGGEVGTVIAFHTAETESVELVKETCSGGELQQHQADYNKVFFPAPL